MASSQYKRRSSISTVAIVRLVSDMNPIYKEEILNIENNLLNCGHKLNQNLL